MPTNAPTAATMIKTKLLGWEEFANEPSMDVNCVAVVSLGNSGKEVTSELSNSPSTTVDTVDTITFVTGSRMTSI